MFPFAVDQTQLEFDFLDINPPKASHPSKIILSSKYLWGNSRARASKESQLIMDKIFFDLGAKVEDHVVEI